MINLNEPAFPSAPNQNYEETLLVGGLTKLEYFAIKIKAVYISKGIHWTNKDVIEEAYGLLLGIEDFVQASKEGR